MKLKNIAKKIILQEKSSSNAYIKFLRKKGVEIGEHCTIFDPTSVRIDSQNPWMLKIGDYVRITAGVQILTHDYSFSVLASISGDILGSVQEVVLGNNIFIGRNAIILKGVHIGDNVIIGAGSVVSKNCEENSVYAGIPAKRICSVEQMYKRWKSRECENAKQVALNYFERTGEVPDENILREYQSLFIKRDTIPDSLYKLMWDSGNLKKCEERFYNTSPEFQGIEEFLKWCEIQ